MKIPTTLYQFFIHFIKPYKWYMFNLFTAGLFWGIQVSLAPYLLKLIINEIADSSDRRQLLQMVKIPAIAYVILFLAITTNFRIIDWVKLTMFPALKKDISLSMFAYLKKHSHSYFQNNFSGSLSKKISDMIDGTVFILNLIDETFAQFTAIVIAITVMFFVHPLFALILLGWVSVFILVSFYFTRHVHNLSMLFSQSLTTLSGKMVDSISNVMNTRLFSRHGYEVKRIEEAVNDTMGKDRAMQWHVLKMRIFQDASIVSLIALMLAALIYLYIKELVTVGDFVLILIISTSIFHAIWFLANQFIQFSENLGKCSQALTIITQPHEIVDVADAKELEVQAGKIAFFHVNFYHKNNNKVFEDMNVTIQPSQKIGLVGFSGSGKSSFVYLILRFFDLKSGQILIDEQDISQVTRDSLRTQISMIPQDTSLFHRSLMENIRYGKIDASDEAVIAASKKAHCHEFICELPEGYNALVGERGIKLSGGQRQRIAIARAILKDAPILILDEATSSLDSVTEQHIQESLDFLMAGRTTIIIAHRLSTLLKMDRILVFDQGKIIEDGDHQSLLRMQGHYAKMWQIQAGGFLPDQS